MTHNYFQAKLENPYHISIGGIVRNEEGKICCHYFDTFTHPSIGTLENFILLMRETIEPGELIEDCLARGLMEEFGITAELNAYLGSIVSHYRIGENPTVIEKTTLYFLCDFISQDESKRQEDDPEAASEILWLDPSEMILRMKEQASRLTREDLDESQVIENLLALPPQPEKMEIN